LVSSPEILILDEPAAAVDIENEHMLYQLLIKLNKERHLTIVMVTHSIESIEESMNKIFVIKNRTVNRRK
jgi:ABC-type Mn2+/Zn2+ transport system ATPase subunit